MKINKTYRSLLDKSINSMLSAIEIYNKPNFSYREETFAILAVNAWELILKAHLLKCCNYNMKHLYQLEPKIKLNGTKSALKQPKLNRTGNPTTIGIFEAIYRLEVNKIILNNNLKNSLESLIELRDNAIHFHNEKQISKELQELGFACIKNYMNFIKMHNIDIDLTNYNFYLMPLAYVDSRTEVDAIMTDEVKKYLDFVKNKVDTQDDEDDFTIAISIDISFNKSNSFEGINFKYGADGLAVIINEEDIRTKYPLTHSGVVEKAKKRYSNFIMNHEFHKVMRGIKRKEALFHERKLDPENPKSQRKPFYSSNIWKELDKNYSKK
jgi:hypothetical protein